jgi:hypothetical protein
MDTTIEEYYESNTHPNQSFYYKHHAQFLTIVFFCMSLFNICLYHQTEGCLLTISNLVCAE